MQKSEQEYAKSSFADVASKYDEIPFFKISATYVAQIINHYKDDDTLDILDVACGTGNVVLECASSISRADFDAVDISEGMLVKAQENAVEKNLTNIKFHLQDITKLTLEKQYDVITCSYALFFLPDAHQVLKTLVGLLKEEGIVIFTSFLKNAFSPSNEILLPLLREYGSPSAQKYDMDTWENLKRVEDIERLCGLSGINTIQIEDEEIRYGMDVDEWWELLNNTGYKGMLMELTPEDYEHVKTAYYDAMFKYADMDGEVELIADTYFVVVSP
ncbi:class I SAM-dependent methyltransferase [Sulfurovum sp.]|uniref:class I SAM-dependent methyltransferase n=1 Tax=Sulfurovum sp. TaxID=1969726 RepID=UPI002867FF6B|nr:class I SAM-dependent methyltransferase [Sulfurovum sp.]